MQKHLLWICVAVQSYLAFYPVECDRETLPDAHVRPYIVGAPRNHRKMLAHHHSHLRRWPMSSDIYFFGLKKESEKNRFLDWNKGKSLVFNCKKIETIQH